MGTSLEELRNQIEPQTGDWRKIEYDAEEGKIVIISLGECYIVNRYFKLDGKWCVIPDIQAGSAQDVFLYLIGNPVMIFNPTEMRRVQASISACAGISTSALEAGVMSDLVVLCKGFQWLLDQKILKPDWYASEEVTPEICESTFRQCTKMLKSTLARIEGGE